VHFPLITHFQCRYSLVIETDMRVTGVMPKEQSLGKPTNRRYSEEAKAAAEPQRSCSVAVPGRKR
jgi:hypothetical protein